MKNCSVPLLHQREVIRSALALKLHCFEDTGAILAALTTSLPEEPGGQRNWDYRYCWLRDAYFALTAFHYLGHFEEMEAFLKVLLNIGHTHEHSRDRLRPVYILSQGLPLPETEHPNWAGYQGGIPVRNHNQAAEHVQNDNQSMFAFGLILDWARVAGDAEMAALLTERSLAFHRGDRDCPLAYEPSGEDFLSPCLMEADLVRRLLPQDAFAAWLDDFLPDIPRDGRADWLAPGIVSDPSDGKLVHLDGVNLSRAWNLRNFANALPADDPRIAALRAAAEIHAEAGIASVSAEHCAGGHWLVSFAAYLVTGR